MTSPPAIPLEPGFARAVRLVFGPGRIHLMTWQTEPEIMTEYLKRCREEGTLPRSVYVVESPTINAFAQPSGRIAVSTAFLAKKTPQEVAALLGHELQHLSPGQRLMKAAITWGAALLVPVLFVADKALQARGALPKDGVISGRIKGAILAVGTPLAFLWGFLFSSRLGELNSDDAGAKFGGPKALARDLKQLEGVEKERERQSAPGEKAWREVLRTHPPTAERIARLEGNPEPMAR